MESLALGKNMACMEYCVRLCLWPLAHTQPAWASFNTLVVGRPICPAQGSAGVMDPSR